MYSADYSIDGRDYVQASAAVSWPASQGNELRFWAASLERFRPAWTTLKLSFDGERIRRTVTVTCEAERLPALRRLMASLSRAQRSFGVLVELPSSAPEHDALAAFDAGTALDLCPPVFDHGGTLWTGPWGRGYRHLDALFEQAVLEQQPLVYQAVLTRHTPSSEVLRKVKHSVIRLREVKGFGSARLAGLDTIASAYPGASYLVSESIAAGHGASMLEDLLQRLSGQDKLFTPAMRARPHDDAGRAIAIDLDAVDPGMEDAFETAAAAAPASLLADLFGWRPSGVAADLAERPDPAPPEPAPAGGSPISSPPSEGSDFFFVSYARKDAADVAPFLGDFAGAGVPFWYDAGIEAGEAWVQTLEDRLERCMGVLLFVSPDALSSAYVRSEITFAYVLKKALFPIVLRDAPLPPGLRIMLSGVQFARVGEHAARVRLIDTLAAWSRKRR